MNSLKLCHKSDISDPGCLEFEITLADRVCSAFLVQIKGQISAFVNSCPHTGVELNWSANQFLNLDNEYILCSLHGARFRPADGYCVWGPCAGNSLTMLLAVLEDDYIVVKYE